MTTFIFLFLLIPIDLNKKIIKKIININSTFEQYSFFRNDNWLISIKSIYIYREGQNKSFDKHLFIEDFSNIINFNEYKNIFIIINESYPNFKNKLLKDKLYKIILHNNENDIIVNNYKKDWSKKYSTQGAELNLFCGQKKNFLEFKNKSLEKYIVDNDCYFQKYKTVNKTFIHTYKLETFNRLRYKNYFEKIIGLTYLKKLNLDMCEGSFFSICDHTVLPVIRNFLYEGSNLVILLTVNNHVPQVLISKSNLINCREHHPLNINKNICSSFHNQLLFNKALSSFISQLKKNELLIFYSDTPPIFPLRERIHFEDYIDVYTFEKK